MPRKHRHTSQQSRISVIRSKGLVSDLRSVIFRVSNEQRTFHSPEVEKLTDEARELRVSGNGSAAEKLYRQALAHEPIQPDLLNNLASSLLLQGRNREAQSLTETIHLLFPDYLFARTSLASAAIRAGNLELAANLLEPLFERRDFHYSEFDSLCIAQIELLAMSEELSSAHDWLKMWEDCNPKHPSLDFYRRLLQQGTTKSG
jgi:tetratricopeptide (TPR) repeat protein